MAEEDRPRREGVLADLLREEARLFPRLVGVFRFDAAVYREIEADANAIPGAFAVVFATAVLAGLGQASPAAIFLGIAGAVLVWGLSSALVWLAGAIVLGRVPDYARLLRCLGFAYAWNGLALAGFLPWIGSLIQWAGFLLWAAALVLATREALQATQRQAILICLVALALPIALFVGVLR
jgi:hypothetical protein